MTFATSMILDVRPGGSDTANGCGFDPGYAVNGFNTGAVTSANTTSPQFSDANYAFVSNDIDAWIYAEYGTNLIPGWYRIASVSGGVATLDGAIGSGVLWSGVRRPQYPSTVAGCSASSSLTGVRWTIDYSQSTSYRLQWTDLASTGAGLTCSSSAQPFGKQMIGNVFQTVSGTNFNVNKFVISNVVSAVATVVTFSGTQLTTGVGSSGVANLGGSLASLGRAGLITTASGGLAVFVKSGTHAITSNTSNADGGVFNVGAQSPGVFGWDTHRHSTNLDSTQPLIQFGVNTTTMFSSRGTFYNLNIDGNGYTNASLGGGNGAFDLCTFRRITLTSTTAKTRCRAYECSSSIFGGPSSFCEAYECTATPFLPNAGGNNFCLSYDNTGASTDGFGSAGSQPGGITNCIAYNNGRDGFRTTGLGCYVINCIAESNAGYGYNPTTLTGVLYINNAGYGNALGLYNPSADFKYNGMIDITAGSVFVDAPNHNFALNNIANRGAALRAMGMPSNFPRLTTQQFLDLGAVQHQDSGGGIVTHPGMLGI